MPRPRNHTEDRAKDTRNKTLACDKRVEILIDDFLAAPSAS